MRFLNIWQPTVTGISIILSISGCNATGISLWLQRKVQLDGFFAKYDGSVVAVDHSTITNPTIQKQSLQQLWTLIQLQRSWIPPITPTYSAYKAVCHSSTQANVEPFRTRWWLVYIPLQSILLASKVNRLMHCCTSAQDDVKYVSSMGDSSFPDDISRVAVISPPG